MQYLIPYSIEADIVIEGIANAQFSSEVEITKGDNASATFSFDVEGSSSPYELLDKIVSISFLVADENGSRISLGPLVIGKTRQVEYNPASGKQKVSGYDYGGIHNLPGERVDANITQTVAASTSTISQTGIVGAGYAPIFDVVDPRQAAGETYYAVDGRDYYVDTLNGNIYIPVASILIGKPGALNYKYQASFNNLAGLLQSIATLKGWTIPSLTIPEYSSGSKEPLISLSNESIIDAMKKILEVGGFKIDTANYPSMRIYSEVDNYAADSILSFTKSDYFENTLLVRKSFENIINSQKVKSGKKEWNQISLAASQEIVTYAATIIQSDYGNFTNALNITLRPSEVTARYEVPLDGYYDITINTTIGAGGAITQSYDYINSKLIINVQRYIQADANNPVNGAYRYYWPQVAHSVMVYGRKISYSAVNSSQEWTENVDIEGITEILKGDDYEHGYIETQAQAQALAKSILLSRKLPCDCSFDVPLHLAQNIDIGCKVQVTAPNGTTVKGIIRGLRYKVNLETGEGTVSIEMKGEKL